ncbi:386_t:CDS:1, partial [Paraglomus occultum]
ALPRQRPPGPTGADDDRDAGSGSPVAVADRDGGRGTLLLLIETWGRGTLLLLLLEPSTPPSQSLSTTSPTITESPIEVGSRVSRFRSPDAISIRVRSVQVGRRRRRKIYLRGSWSELKSVQKRAVGCPA